MGVYLIYLGSHFVQANKKCLNVRMRFWFFTCIPTFRQKDEDEVKKDSESAKQSKTKKLKITKRQSKQKQTQQRIPTKIKVPPRKL